MTITDITFLATRGGFISIPDSLFAIMLAIIRVIAIRAVLAVNIEHFVSNLCNFHNFVLSVPLSVNPYFLYLSQHCIVLHDTIYDIFNRTARRQWRKIITCFLLIYYFSSCILTITIVTAPFAARVNLFIDSHYFF